VAVARHFESMDVDEEDCIGGFLERLDKGGLTGGSSGVGATSSTSSLASAAAASSAAAVGCSVQTEYARKTAYFDGRAPPVSVKRRKRSKWAARPGEQVAAKVTRTDENGSWILASVQRFYAETDTYDVQDEDDTSKLIRLPWAHVMRLSSGSEGCFTKGTCCMAIFPETTSFYRATVSKAPVWKLDNRANVPTVKEIIVKFEDDEDAHGRTPHRRVPSRFVIPLPSTYFYDESEDVDLGTAGAAAAAAATSSSPAKNP